LNLKTPTIFGQWSGFITLTNN